MFNNKVGWDSPQRRKHPFAVDRARRLKRLLAMFAVAADAGTEVTAKDAEAEFHIHAATFYTYRQTLREDGMLTNNGGRGRSSRWVLTPQGRAAAPATGGASGPAQNQTATGPRTGGGRHTVSNGRSVHRAADQGSADGGARFGVTAHR